MIRSKHAIIFAVVMMGSFAEAQRYIKRPRKIEIDVAPTTPAKREPSTEPTAPVTAPPPGQPSTPAALGDKQSELGFLACSVNRVWADNAVKGIMGAKQMIADIKRRGETAPESLMEEVNRVYRLNVHGSQPGQGQYAASELSQRGSAVGVFLTKLAEQNEDALAELSKPIVMVYKDRTKANSLLQRYKKLLQTMPKLKDTVTRASQRSGISGYWTAVALKDEISDINRYLPGHIFAVGIGRQFAPVDARMRAEWNKEMAQNRLKDYETAYQRSKVDLSKVGAQLAALKDEDLLLAQLTLYDKSRIRARTALGFLLPINGKELANEAEGLDLFEETFISQHSATIQTVCTAGVGDALMRGAADYAAHVARIEELYGVVWPGLARFKKLEESILAAEPRVKAAADAERQGIDRIRQIASARTASEINSYVSAHPVQQKSTGAFFGSGVLPMDNISLSAPTAPASENRYLKSPQWPTYTSKTYEDILEWIGQTMMLDHVYLVSGDQTQDGNPLLMTRRDERGCIVRMPLPEGFEEVVKQYGESLTRELGLPPGGRPVSVAGALGLQHCVSGPFHVVAKIESVEIGGLLYGYESAQPGLPDTHHFLRSDGRVRCGGTACYILQAKPSLIRSRFFTYEAPRSDSVALAD